MHVDPGRQTDQRVAEPFYGGAITPAKPKQLVITKLNQYCKRISGQQTMGLAPLFLCGDKDPHFARQPMGITELVQESLAMVVA